MKFVNYHMIFCVLLNVTVGLRAIDHISINCGGAAAAEGLGGRQWLRDAAAKGSSTVITAVEPARYETARISRSQFSYSFRLNPGQKSIRFHFNPSSYDQFESLNDLFTVEAGPYSLLANFSASITARVLAVDVIVREFCIITKEDETLDLVFSPENKNYAFINRIEIISAPSTTVSYCHGGDTGARVIGQKPLINVDNTTALERVHYQHIKWGSASPDDDIRSMFGMWGSASSSLKKKAKTWRVSVDVGFKYLVRLHLCDVGLEMDFVLLIDNVIILTSAELRQQREKEQNMLWYNNYMVMVEAGKEEEKRDISISLHSRHEFLDRHGPLEGFEVFKLSNHDRGLASPSPLLKRRDSQQISLPPLRALLYNLHLYIKHLDYTALYIDNLHLYISPLKYDILYAYTICLICMIVTVINVEQKISVDNFTKEVEMPLARVKQPCCLFSLPEVQSALKNFHDRRVLGRGKSGKVYKRHMDNGIEVVEIKRSKPCFKQWEYRFWTEVAMLSYLFWIEVAMLSYRFRTVVAMLSELLRVNLVFFIENCKFVCGYMLYRIFGDYLYRLVRESDDFCHLSWKQDRDICIGAGRVLDYHHMGHGILPIDLKASTMLLDKNLDPKVSDFGLAKIGRGGLTISQHIKKFEGSSEYRDTILFGTSYQTEKIYSFGALVLEIMCGRPAPPWNEQDKDSLITWAIKNKGQVDHIVAPSLRGQISPKPNSLKTFLKIAEGPLHDEPKKRPGTAEILRKLAYALPQQEKAESVAMKERNGLASPLLSSILTSREKNMDDDLSSFTFVGVWDTFRDYETDSLLGLQCSRKIHKGFNYVASSLLGVRCPWKIHTGFHYKASYDKPGIRKCFPGKKLNSEGVESNLVWQERSVGRVSCLDGLNLFSFYSNASELFTKDSLENLRRGVSVQSLPLDIELKTLFGAACAVESKRKTLFGAARAVESKRKTLFRAARAVGSKIKNFYRDFKASNILLDGISDSFCSPPSFLFETNKSYLAKLADFCLVKMDPTAGHSHVSTQVMGTHGYVAPECFATGRWYVKMADPTASGPHIITPVVEIYHTIINPNATGEYDNTLFGSEIERNQSNKACGCTECYSWALIIVDELYI